MERLKQYRKDINEANNKQKQQMRARLKEDIKQNKLSEKLKENKIKLDKRRHKAEIKKFNDIHTKLLKMNINKTKHETL